MQNLLMKLKSFNLLSSKDHHFKCFHLVFNLMMQNAQLSDCGKFKPP